MSRSRGVYENFGNLRVEEVSTAQKTGLSHTVIQPTRLQSPATPSGAQINARRASGGSARSQHAEGIPYSMLRGFLTAC
ncbi:UNVERIFIED_CONTAM: hypothetical protein FKN15_019701 [Acipenser sinensis]